MPSRVPTAFTVTSSKLDERTSAISVQGELDLSTAPRLKWALLDALEAGASQLVVDLSAVTFMDSTALGVLVGVNRIPALSAPLTIVCQPGTVRGVFEVSGMDAAFKLCSTLEQARAQAAPAD